MKRYEGMLRNAGLRVTKQRLEVLAYVDTHPHCVVEEVVAHVRARLGKASVQAVYDALAGLTDKEVVRRIQPAGSPTRYETRTGDNHHHVICRSCGRIEDVDCVLGSAPCLTASDTRGFSIDEAEVVFWGVCAGCRADDSPDTDYTAGSGTTGADTTDTFEALETSGSPPATAQFPVKPPAPPVNRFEEPHHG